MARGSSAPTYCPVSTHTTLEDAILALHAHDAFEYVTAYNYGAFGNGRVYRCISHEDCERRLRILESTKDEEEIPVTFQLAAAGEHGDQVTNRKRVGIDLSVKGEVDGLLARGVTPKKCLLALQNKYADQPEMLVKVPDEGQVRNRLLTLRKHNRKSPGATTTALSLRGRKRRAEWDESSESEMEVEVENSAVEESTRSKRHEEIATVESDIEEEERFDKEKLTKEFAALPGRPVFWSILKKTKYIRDKSEDVVTEWMTGQVIGWQTKGNSSTKWVVRYTDGEIRLLELEELVDEIRSAAKLGLNVTDRPLDL
ncbi:hypothetical protein JG688_00010163 [Phytophthora aleatoria]|uniref:Uncharacterized protein n=1 Tax=Phytophthora aleatoria TaxID=2496075 RepID=A0A8J5MF75_9STRA|nr:hypothetical protein JG688_00010163 [Phytophthora aleatoria]